MKRFESFAEKIRNYLSPYSTLIRFVETYVDGKMSEEQFKTLFNKFRQNYTDNLKKFIELSKRDELESLNFEKSE